MGSYGRIYGSECCDPFCILKRSLVKSCKDVLDGNKTEINKAINGTDVVIWSTILVLICQNISSLFSFYSFSSPFHSFSFLILLYNTLSVLPYINMNPPRVYMSSQSWTPPTSLPIPSLWVIPVHQPQASCSLSVLLPVLPSAPELYYGS